MRCPTYLELPSPNNNDTGWPWTEESPQLSVSMPDNSPWPRISIVTPSFNQGEFIEQTIRSVLLQGYPNIEYIIIDGNSTDVSKEIIKKYEPWLKYWVYEPDRGQSHAINKGFRHASGQIYAFINADDYYLPGAFSHIADVYRSDVGLWVGTTLQVGLDGVLKGERIPLSLAFDDVANWQSNWFRQPGCFFSKEVFEKVGGINENLEFSLDFDLWLAILKVSVGQRIDATLAVARNHPKMKTQNKGGKGFAEDRVVQIRHGAEELAIGEIIRLYEKSESYEKKMKIFITARKYLRRYKEYFQRK